MKKKMATLLATLALVGSASAFAANPMSDVAPTSWEYQAVQTLASEGLVTTFPKAAMQAEQPLTRMQMAMLIVDAIKHAPMADTQQKSVIITLAKEYRAELMALGEKSGQKLDVKKYLGIEYGDVTFRLMSGPVLDNVHKASLEEMIPYVGPDVGEKMKTDPAAKAFLGNVQKQYQAGIEKKLQALHAMPDVGTNDKIKQQIQALEQAKKIPATKLPILNGFNRKNVDHQFDTRVHVNVFGVMTPQTKALARVEADFRWGEKATHQVRFDRLLVAQRIGKVDLVLGRQGVMIGDGLTYNHYIDGVLATVGNHNTRFTIVHGWPSYYTSQFSAGVVDPASMAYVLNGAEGKLQATVFHAEHHFGKKLRAKAYFLKGNDGIPVNAWGTALSYRDGNFWAGGEFAKLIGASKLPQPYGLLSSLLDDDYAWTAGIGYGQFNEKKKGTWDVSLRYLFEGRVAPIMNSYTFQQPFINNYKAWSLTTNYALQDNMSLQFVTFFNGKSVQNTQHYPNLMSLAVKYRF